MGKQTCCVLCPIPRDKTSEALDRVSQHMKSWVVVVGVWITGMFLWWHLEGSKDRFGNTTILVTHLSLSPAPYYRAVASLTALSCLDAGMDQGHSDEDSRLALSHSLLGSWQHMVLHIPLPLQNQHLLFAFILTEGNLSIFTPIPSFSCLEAVIIPACLWNFCICCLKYCF